MRGDQTQQVHLSEIASTFVEQPMEDLQPNRSVSIPYVRGIPDIQKVAFNTSLIAIMIIIAIAMNFDSSSSSS